MALWFPFAVASPEHLEKINALDCTLAVRAVKKNENPSLRRKTFIINKRGKRCIYRML